MAGEPNADLIGFVFTAEDGTTFTVERTWEVLDSYVVCRVGDDTVIRPASVVRRRKQLDR